MVKLEDGIQILKAIRAPVPLPFRQVLNTDKNLNLLEEGHKTQMSEISRKMLTDLTDLIARAGAPYWAELARAGGALQGRALRVGALLGGDAIRNCVVMLPKSAFPLRIGHGRPTSKARMMYEAATVGDEFKGASEGDSVQRL